MGDNHVLLLGEYCAHNPILSVTDEVEYEWHWKIVKAIRDANYWQVIESEIWMDLFRKEIRLKGQEINLVHGERAVVWCLVEAIIDDTRDGFRWVGVVRYYGGRRTDNITRRDHLPTVFTADMLMMNGGRLNLVNSYARFEELA